MEESNEGGAYPSWIVESQKKKKKCYTSRLERTIPNPIHSHSTGSFQAMNIYTMNKAITYFNISIIQLHKCQFLDTNQMFLSGPICSSGVCKM
jgi:hypothetical protein